MLQYRELFKKLTTSDLNNKYQNASLGFALSLLSPLLLMLVLWVVFRHMFDMEDFALYLLVGIITWRFFANGTSSALASIVGRKNLITNVYIPRWLITCSSVASSLISSTLEFVVLLPLILILGGQISASALLFPMIHLLYAIMICGVGFIVAALFVRYRDLQHIWEVFLTSVFFLCPIIYPLSRIPDYYMDIYMLNPLTRVINIYRDLLVDGAFPAARDLLFVTLATMVLFTLGCLVFWRLEPRFAEEV